MEPLGLEDGRWWVGSGGGSARGGGRRVWGSRTRCGGDRHGLGWRRMVADLGRFGW